MYRYSTKTPGEREDEEVERLVRPSPKVKPPRYDRRRERVEPEKDKDLSKEDKDLSMNYKTIGGSLVLAGEDLISVRLKEDPKKVVQVTRETLKSSPEKYEEMGDDAEAEPKQKVPSKPELEKKSPEGDAKPEKRVPDAKSDAKTQNALHSMIQNDSELGVILKDFTAPNSDLFQWAKSAPETPVTKIAPFLRGRTLPNGIETMGDLQRILLLGDPEPEAKPKKTKAPKKPKSPKNEDGDSEDDSAEDGVAATKEWAPGAPDRKASKEEISAAKNQLTQTFPPEIAADLLLSDPPLHPDEIHSLISDYHMASSREPSASDLEGMRDVVSSVYATDPNQVKPPKKAKAKDGSIVSYDDLSPEEQASALRTHQIQTVAMSLATEKALASHMESKGAPKDLATDLSNFMLSGSGESPVDRQKRASEAAESIFYHGLEADSKRTKPLSDAKVRDILAAVKDPAAKRLAVGYFQAQDYQAARNQYLNADSPDHISEHQSPTDIARGLNDATAYLRQQAARYPDGTAQDTGLAFRSKVYKHVSALMPEKAAAVQGLLDKYDNRYYDEALKRHGAAVKAYQDQQKEAQAEAEKNSLSSDEWLASNGINAPLEPVKPPRYDLYRKSPEELKEASRSLWDDFQQRTARDRSAAFRVANRCLFTYPNASAMGHKREAVYWGVDPYPKGHEGFEPYVAWEQAQARELGEADFSRILTGARSWLRAPVLSSNIEGIVRDTQLRAALDLSIRTEGYSAVLHPTLYNHLLARLAGKPQDETLLTVTARDKMPKDNVAIETTQADQFLMRLDRMASLVQDNHEKWGMPFEAAKSLVNTIDKLADDFETVTYGDKSLLTRQAQLITGSDKTAEVIQRDSDEPYMDTFKNPMAPIQTEADEPYMSAYADDQSSDVHHGKASSRPLAP